MNRNLYINGRLYWKTRTPTKRGYFAPVVRNGSMFADTASTAQRRKERRAFERQADKECVQLACGVLVIYDRQAYRIVEVRELPADLWGEEHDKAFEDACAAWALAPRTWPCPEKETWRERPVMVIVRPDTQPEAKPLHLRVRASYSWDVLPEHYAVCRSCGVLPPCQHEIDENNIEAAMDRAEDLMSIQPGCCLGCTEPITSRMKAVRFPGPNLWRPDMPENSAVFHARAECAGDVESYRRQWQKRQQEPLQAELPAEDAGDDA